MSRTAAAVALVLVAAAGVATWRWLDREPALVVPATPTPTPVAPPSVAAPAQADLGTKPKDLPKAAAEARLQFPDGSSMPALNGVKADIVITWGKRPFTRVVGTEDGPGGWKWYVHENGTRSTTAMVDMNGVPQPTGIVVDPEKPLPIMQDGTPPGSSTGSGAPKK